MSFPLQKEYSKKIVSNLTYNPSGLIPFLFSTDIDVMTVSLNDSSPYLDKQLSSKKLAAVSDIVD